jgi:hypothetical protein
LLASRNKLDYLARCRELLGMAAPTPIVKKTTAEWILFLLDIDINRCPQCGNATLERSELLLVPRRLDPPPTRPALQDTS